MTRRLLVALLALFAAASCGGIVVEDPPKPECRLNSDCATRRVCLAGTCAGACEKDSDCFEGQRCLATLDGHGCVFPAKVDAGH